MQPSGFGPNDLAVAVEAHLPELVERVRAFCKEKAISPKELAYLLEILSVDFTLRSGLTKEDAVTIYTALIRTGPHLLVESDDG